MNPQRSPSQAARNTRRMALFAGLWWFGCVTAGGAGKIDVRLQEALQGQPDAPVPVLIRVHGRAPLSLLSPGSGARQKLTAAVDLLRGTADATQSPIRDTLDRWGVRYRAFWVVNAIAAELTSTQLHALARREEVLRIDYDVGGGAPRPTLEAPAAKVAAAVEWNVTQVRAPEVWAQGYRGQGVVVAGADTGYQWDHPALRDRYRGWNGSGVNHAYHWHDAVHGDIPGPGAVLGNACGFDNPVPCDDDSHGTHTMGTVLGDDGAANQIGIAPDARWIACRNMEDGNGRPSTYIECFEWFMAPTNASGMQPDPGRAPHIISNSWSCPPSETCAFDALQETIE